MENFDGGIHGAISGFAVALIGILGLNKKIDSKVSKDAFIEYKDSIDKQFENVNKQLISISENVKDIFLHMPKRNGDT
jgi:hypothetical protein